MNVNKQKGGLLKWLIIIIALIALASYFFGFSVQDVVENPQTQANYHYVLDHVEPLYVQYVAPTVQFLWNDIFMRYVWNNFRSDISSMKEGKPTLLEKLAPQFPVAQQQTPATQQS